jgi:hypothetical protein
MSDQAAGAFTKGIQFVWPDGHGVKMHDLSAFEDEGEVVVDGPSTFEVTAATMTPTGTLVVVLKRTDSFINYLTPDDHASSTSAPAVLSPAPAAAPSPVPAPSALSILSSLSVDQVSLLVRSPPFPHSPHPLGCIAAFAPC